MVLRYELYVLKRQEENDVEEINFLRYISRYIERANHMWDSAWTFIIRCSELKKYYLEWTNMGHRASKNHLWTTNPNKSLTLEDLWDNTETLTLNRSSMGYAEVEKEEENKKK